MTQFLTKKGSFWKILLTFVIFENAPIHTEKSAKTIKWRLSEPWLKAKNYDKKVAIVCYILYNTSAKLCVISKRLTIPSN